MENCIEKLLKANPPLTVRQQIHQLEIAVHHLKNAQAQHVQFQAEYARAFWEQQKRSIVGLQTMASKMGRHLQEEKDDEEARQQQALEAGRIKKRSLDAPTRRKKNNKKRAL